MFSKSDNFVTKYNWSITNKLTLLYALATIGMLILVACIFYYTLSLIIFTAEEQYLIDEINIIKTILSHSPTDYSALNQEVNATPAALKNASYHYYVALKDNNEILMATLGMSNELKRINFPKAETRYSKIILWQAKDKKKFLLMSGPVKFDQKGRPLVIMNIALEVTYPDGLTKKYLHILLLCLFLSTFFIIVIGWFIAKKGLSSLYGMTKLVSQMTAGQLSRRVNIENWPKELTQLGSAFNSMLASLEESLNRISHCTTEIAHELRTPINNLIAGTSVILSRPRKKMEYKELLESNLEEYFRLTNLFENILFLAKADGSQIHLNTTTINISQEITTALESYRALADENNLNIEYQGSGVIKADPILFRRAVSNLLSNAIKYTQSGGLIKINSNFIDDNTLKISVSDNGIGIAEKHHQFIFNRFYCVDNESSHYSDGIGLGLAIVKSIMKLHKGTITIQSRFDEGTSINLFFPSN